MLKMLSFLTPYRRIFCCTVISLVLLTYSFPGHAAPGKKETFSYVEPEFLSEPLPLERVVGFSQEELPEKLTLAMEEDVAEIQYTLGYMYQFEEGVTRNYKEAEKWYLKAAKQDYIPAIIALSKLYKLGGEGTGIQGSVRKSLSWLHKADRLGSPEASYELGQHYENGVGVFFNDRKAFDKYLYAAENGVLNAHGKLGLFYQYGRGTEKNIQKAHDHYKILELEALNEEVIKEVRKLLGKIYSSIAERQVDPVLRFDWLKVASEYGNADAVTMVADAYRDGVGTEKNYESAIKWYEKAAAQKDAYAMKNLGFAYSYGLGVERDYCEAFKWYEDCAKRGSPECAWQVGSFYWNGNCVKKNMPKAQSWFANSRALSKH